MTFNLRINDSYAYAFFKILSEKSLDFNSFSGLVSDIVDISTLMNISTNFGNFLSNPMYSSTKKKQLLNDFLRDSLSPIVVNFLNLLCDTKKIININSIFNYLLEIVLKSTNSYIVEIQVSDANNFKLDIKKLDIILANWFLSKRILEDFKIPFFPYPMIFFTVQKMPKIVGGFNLNIITESKVIDFSITGKIQRITKVLEL